MSTESRLRTSLKPWTILWLTFQPSILPIKNPHQFGVWEKLGRFDRARVGTQLAPCIDLDEVMDGIHAYEICNHLEFGVIRKVFNDGIGFQKDTVKAISESHQKGEW